jgi:hypothetical protein
MHIIELANRQEYREHQSLYMPPVGRPDIKPCILPSPPPPPAPPTADDAVPPPQQ